jgi:hypothetical protein
MSSLSEKLRMLLRKCSCQEENHDPDCLGGHAMLGRTSNHDFSDRGFVENDKALVFSNRDESPPPLEKEHEFVDGFIVQRSTRKPTFEERINNYLWRMALR